MPPESALTFCTLAGPLEIAQARVMAESARRHHPNAHVLAVTTDELGLREVEPFQRVAGTPATTIADVLRIALPPTGTAVYLAPCAYVLAPLHPVLEAASGSPVAVAVARAMQTVPQDGLRPDAADLLAMGAMDPGLVAVAADPAGHEFLDWWSTGQREAAGDDRAMPSDGRWLELAAASRPEVAVLSDPGCAVSYWNIAERPLSRDDAGILAAGSRLRSVNFYGFRPDQPYWLSEFATRVRVVDNPLLAGLCGDYAECLRAAGWFRPRQDLAGLAHLGNGQRVDEFVRDLWEERLRAGGYPGDPLTEHGAERFIAWLREPVRPGVSRYLHAVYDAREDLQGVFPNLDGEDAERLGDWGRSQEGDEIVGGLLPDPPDSTTRQGTGARAGLAVDVIGFLDETLGLGEAARSYVEALRRAGVPVTTTAVATDSPLGDADRGERPGAGRWQDVTSGPEPTVNLACLNGDHLAALVGRRGRGVLGGRPTIGQWGWETDALPDSWAPAFSLVDEVWVYTTFMARNLGRLLPVPVVVVPPAVIVASPAELPGALAFDDRFTFLFMLDYFSTLERKNPIGLITAFRRAFAPSEGPRLLIKTINGHRQPRAADALRQAAGDHPDIEFFDGYLEPGQKSALLASADCFVSLHRSEGFGLPLAEAMALGTPVIATGYSGNTDFSSGFNSFPVDYRVCRVGPESGVYPPHGHWAEPDLDHAAALMRRVIADPQEAARRAARARTDIEDLYSPTAVGAVARARLELLGQGSPAGDRSPPSGRGPRPEGLVSRGVRAAARRLRTSAG